MITFTDSVLNCSKTLNNYNEVFNIDESIKELESIEEKHKILSEDLIQNTQKFNCMKEQEKKIAENIKHIENTNFELLDDMKNMKDRYEKVSNTKCDNEKTLITLTNNDNFLKQKINEIEEEIEKSNKSKINNNFLISKPVDNNHVLKPLQEKFKDKKEKHKTTVDKRNHLVEQKQKIEQGANDLSEELNIFKTYKSELQNGVQNSKNIIKNVMDEISKISTYQNTKHKDIQEFQNSLLKIDEEGKSIISSKSIVEQKLKQERRELNKIYSLTDENIKEMKEEIENKREIIEMYSKQLHENELKHIRFNESEKEKRFKLLQEIDKLKGQIKVLSDEKKDKLHIVSDREKQMSSKNRDIEDLKKKINEMSFSFVEKKKQLEEKNSMIDTLNNTIENLNKEIEKMHKKIDDKVLFFKTKEEEYKRSIQTNEKIVVEIQEKNKLLEEVKKEKESTRSKITELQKELNSNYVFIEQYRVKLKSSEEKEKELTIKLDLFRKENEEMVQQLICTREEIGTKNVECNNIKQELYKKREEINRFKYDLDFLINKGNQTFNDFSSQIQDYMYIIENYAKEKLPHHENDFIQDLSRFSEMSKNTIDIKTDKILSNLHECYKIKENDIGEKYKSSIKQIEEKCKKIELMEMELNNKIKNYEMYDICNIEKNNLINDTYKLINDKRQHILFLKSNLNDIERVNEKFKSLDVNQSLNKIIDKANSVEKFKIKVEDIMRNQSRTLKTFLNNPDVKILDKIQNLEGNVYKLSFMLVLQFIGFLIMYIF